MPVEHVIDEKQGLVLTTLRGSVTFDEFVRHLQALASDPTFDPNMLELLEANDVETDEFNIDQMMSFKDSHVWGPKARRAMVTNSDLVFGLFRMFQITSAHEHGEIALFHNLDEARCWLGLTDPPD